MTSAKAGHGRWLKNRAASARAKPIAADAPSPPLCRLATSGPRPIVRHLFLFWTKKIRESRTGGHLGYLNITGSRLVNHRRRWFTDEDAPNATTNPEERFEWCPIGH